MHDILIFLILWVIASVILAPIIGHYLAAPDEFTRRNKK